MTALFSVFGLPVTPYALAIALSALICLSLSAAALSRRGVATARTLDFTLIALPLSLLGARLFYCLARLPMILAEFGPGFFFDMTRGGYALWGAVGGAALACLICARREKRPFCLYADAVAPYAALMIALARFSEFFSGDGIGAWIENETLMFFPLSVTDAYGEWHYAVFMLEGLIALLIALSVVRADGAAPGKRTLRFLILYAASQTLCESLRQDAYLRFGFVRVSQLTAVIVLALLLIVTLVRRRSAFPLRRAALTIAVFIACVGVCVALEFAKDKSAALPDAAIYCIMALACAGLGASVGSAVRRVNR